MYGKSLTLSHSTRKKISKLLTITDQSHFFLFFGKVFEKILFNSIFEYLQENCLLWDNQSGFGTSDSCEYQLLYIIHDIYASFDCNPPKDVRGMVLDISKAFDRAWHEGIISKIKFLGITGMSLKLLQNFLQNRHHQVFLKGKCSSCAPVFAGVPQSSVFCIRPFVLFNLHK